MTEEALTLHHFVIIITTKYRIKCFISLLPRRTYFPLVDKGRADGLLEQNVRKCQGLRRRRRRGRKQPVCGTVALTT